MPVHDLAYSSRKMSNTHSIFSLTGHEASSAEKANVPESNAVFFLTEYQDWVY